MWPVSLWIHLPYQSCCIYSWWPVGAAVTLHLHSSFGEGRGGGGRGEWLSEMDSNDNQICLHMKQLFPIFPICAFPWVQSSARRVMWRCSEILGFQLHPLSLLLSTAATSTANLLSIIFCQIEFELQTKKRFGLKTLNTLQDNIFNISTQWCQFTYFNHVTAERLSVTTWV